LLQRWWRSPEKSTISLDTRLSFESAWNISVYEQQRIEENFWYRIISTPTQQQLMNYHYMMLG
jgi:hypothetical protein